MRDTSASESTSPDLAESSEGHINLHGTSKPLPIKSMT